MAKFPAMPLWTDAYLADTRHLAGPAEHGAYLLLLMEAWRRPRCALPDNDVTLARLTCSTPDQWGELKPTIMAFWEYDSRRKEWTQKRLLREHKFVAESSEKQRYRAKARWRKDKDPSRGNARPGNARSGNAGDMHQVALPPHPHLEESPEPSRSAGDSLTQTEQTESPARPSDGDGSAAVKRRSPSPTAPLPAPPASPSPPSDEPDDIPFETPSS